MILSGVEVEGSRSGVTTTTASTGPNITTSEKKCKSSSYSRHSSCDSSTDSNRSRSSSSSSLPSITRRLYSCFHKKRSRDKNNETDRIHTKGSLHLHHQSHDSRERNSRNRRQERQDSERDWTRVKNIMKNHSRHDKNKYRNVLTEEEKLIEKDKLLKKGGVTSLPMKILTHPLDRSISSAFVITLFFTLLALLSGVPVVILLCILLPIGIFFKVLSSCYFISAPSLCSLIASFSPASISAATSSSGPSSPVHVDQYHDTSSSSGHHPRSSSYIDAPYNRHASRGRQSRDHRRLSNHHQDSEGVISRERHQFQTSSSSLRSGQHNYHSKSDRRPHHHHQQDQSHRHYHYDNNRLHSRHASLRNRHSRGSHGRHHSRFYSAYPLIPVTPLESFWLTNNVTNNNKFGVCNCLLFFDKTLSLDQLKDIIVSRVLCKDEFWKFSARLVYKGISRGAFWQKIPVDDKLLDSLIFTDDTFCTSNCSSSSWNQSDDVHQHSSDGIASRDDLKYRLLSISNTCLPAKNPLWQIRWMFLSYCNQVCLVLRVHQAVCDGVGLMSLLVSQLADQAPPSTTTFIRTCHGTMTATNSMFKPRFGGINFSLNVCRAVVVGPLTFFLWIWWAFTRRKNNFLKSFSSSHMSQRLEDVMINLSNCLHQKEKQLEKSNQHQLQSNRDQRAVESEGRISPNTGCSLNSSLVVQVSSSSGGTNSPSNVNREDDHHSSSHQSLDVKTPREQVKQEELILLSSSPSNPAGNEFVSEKEKEHWQEDQQEVIVGRGGHEGYSQEHVSAVSSSTQVSIHMYPDTKKKKQLETKARKTNQQTTLIPSLEGSSGGSSSLSHPFQPQEQKEEHLQHQESKSNALSFEFKPQSRHEKDMDLQEKSLQSNVSQEDVKNVSSSSCRMKNKNESNMDTPKKQSSSRGKIRFKAFLVPGKESHSSHRRHLRRNHRSMQRHQREETSNYSSSSFASKGSSQSTPRFQPIKSIYWTSLDLPKVYRIKQITRSCLNDVVLAAVSGAIREYMVSKVGICNPPDLTASIPVDIRGLNDESSTDPIPGYPVPSACSSSTSAPLSPEGPGVSFVLLTSPLPTHTEGCIPRLWEIRHLMEELKASADPAVMYGAQYFLHNLLPASLGRFFVNMIHRNSSLLVSNLQGPSMKVTIGTHRLHKMLYFMSPPSNIPITVNVLSYHAKLLLSVSTTSLLVPSAKSLCKLIHKHIDLMSELLSRRRVPGEVRAKKRPHHVIIEAPVGSGRAYSPVMDYGVTPVTVSPVSSDRFMATMTSLSPSSSSSLTKTTTTVAGVETVAGDTAATAPTAYPASWTVADLTDRLHAVQMQLNHLNEILETEQHDSRTRDSLLLHLESLKEEFSELMKHLRRRKSMADYGPNIVINLEDEDDFDDDMDGDLRPAPRRFSLAGAASTRRSSVVSTAISFAAGRRVSITPSSFAASGTSGAPGTSNRSRPSSSPEPSSPERTSSGVLYAMTERCITGSHSLIPSSSHRSSPAGTGGPASASSASPGIFYPKDESLV